MTGGQTAEPTLAEVQAQYPAWRCAQGISGLFYAQHTTTGQQVTGEDPLDLRDQLKAAQGRHACGQPGTTIPHSAGQM